MNLSVKKVEANRNFANKVWNAGRFIISALENTPDKPLADPDWTPADEYIHARMRQTVRDVNRLFESYQFGEAGRQVYEFFWGEFADWYIESAKLQLKQGGDRAFYTAWTLVRVLDKCLRLLHPYTPFVTEEIWGKLRSASLSKGEEFTVEDGWDEALIIAHWPKSKKEEEWEKNAVNAYTNGTIEHTRAFRSLKTNLNIPINQMAGGTILIDSESRQIVNDQKELIESLSSIKDLEVFVSFPDPDEYSDYPSISIPSSDSMVFLKTKDIMSNKEMKDKLQKELDITQSHIKRLKNLLGSDFAAKAPPQVVEKERSKLEKYVQTAKKIKDQLAGLK